jgi:hypothetical protein
MSWSRPPLRSVAPSGEKARAAGTPTCDASRARQRFVRRSHTRMLLSCELEKSCSFVASGWKTTRCTTPSCSRKTWVQKPLATLKTITDWSVEPVASSWPLES